MWNNIGGVIISVLTLYVVDCVFKPWSGLTKDSIRGVIISVLTLYVVDCVFEPWLGQTKDFVCGRLCVRALVGSNQRLCMW